MGHPKGKPRGSAWFWPKATVGHSHNPDPNLEYRNLEDGCVESVCIDCGKEIARFEGTILWHFSGDVVNSDFISVWYFIPSKGVCNGM